MNIFSKAEKPLKVAESRTITNANKTGDDFVSSWVPVRPGANDHEQIPSRNFNRREYRDGRVEEIKQ